MNYNVRMNKLTDCPVNACITSEYESISEYISVAKIQIWQGSC